MEQLKEHKEFRNQMILITIISIITSFFMTEMIVFGFLFGLIALWNVFSYRQNLKDYNKLNNNK